MQQVPAVFFQEDFMLERSAPPPLDSSVFPHRSCQLGSQAFMACLVLLAGADLIIHVGWFWS